MSIKSEDEAFWRGFREGRESAGQRALTLSEIKAALDRMDAANHGSSWEMWEIKMALVDVLTGGGE